MEQSVRPFSLENNMEPTQDTTTDGDVRQDANPLERAANKFAGLLEAEDTEPPDTQPAIEEPTEEVDEPETEEVEESEDTKAEETTEEPKEEAEETDAKSDEDIVASLKTLDDLANATGLDSEKILGLKVKAKVDGVEEDVPLSKLQASYQKEQHFSAKGKELAREKEAFQVEVQTKRAELEQSLQVSAAVLRDVETSILAEYSDANLAQLKVDDPEQYPIRVIEKDQKVKAIDAKKSELVGQYQQQMQVVQAEKEVQHEAYVKSENEAILEAIPEWANSVKMEAELVEIASYMRAKGYSDDRIKSVYDHLDILVLRDAMKSLKSEQIRKDVKKKKTAKKLKLVKPGTPSEQSVVSNKKRKQQRDRLRKTGRPEDAAGVFAELIMSEGD